MISAFALATLTTGCGNALKEFVRVAKPVVGPVVTTPTADGTSTIKISPGNTSATSTDVSMTAHVTITDRPLIGSDVSARVSVSRQRGNDPH